MIIPTKKDDGPLSKLFSHLMTMVLFFFLIYMVWFVWDRLATLTQILGPWGLLFLLLFVVVLLDMGLSLLKETKELSLK